MTVYRLPNNALRERFKRKRNKVRPLWIDNINEDIALLLGLTLRGAMDITDHRGQQRSFVRTHRYQMARFRNWLCCCCCCCCCVFIYKL